MRRCAEFSIMWLCSPPHAPQRRILEELALPALVPVAEALVPRIVVAVLRGRQYQAGVELVTLNSRGLYRSPSA
jgi:hypothetical protein